MLIVVGTRHVVTALLRTPRIVGRIGLRGSILEKLAHPVGALAQLGGVVEEGILGLTSGTHHLVVQRGELRGVEQRQGALQLIEPVGHFQIQVVAFLRASLGGDDNHTVGTARTVDGRGRGILEDVDALHVVHVDHVQRHIGRHTVDNQKRVAVVNGTDASDFHTHVAARGPARNYLQTGGPTLQGGSEARRRLTGQIFGGDLRDSSRQVAFLLDTISNDYNLVEHLVVLVHDNLHRALSVHIGVLSHIAYITEVQYGIGRTEIETEMSIYIGHGSVRSPFLRYIDTDKRLLVDVENSALDLALSPYGEW